MMRTWSLSLGLALIFCTASIQAQSCLRDTDCDNFRECCQTGKCASVGSMCPCQKDSDCKYGKKCYAIRGVCLIRTRPLFTARPTFSFPTWDPITYNPVTFNPKTFNCVWDSECIVGKTCEGGKCVYKNKHGKDHSSGGGFSWSGGRIVGIVLFGVVTGIISCMYHVCKTTRRPPNLPPQNVNVNARPTGVVRVEGNDHEMQSGNAAATNITVVRIEGNDHEMQPRNAAAAATNVTVVESEDDAPLPPEAPPPYNSLEFESGKNANGNFPEQPPPSYDEAVRNPAVP